MTVRIITDSTADVTPEAARQLNIGVVALDVYKRQVMDAQLTTPAPTHNGQRLKILYASQVAVAPPTFVLFVNDPQLLHFSYRRYIENRLREAFGFDGSPIRIIARSKD